AFEGGAKAYFNDIQDHEQYKTLIQKSAVMDRTLSDELTQKIADRVKRLIALKDNKPRTTTHSPFVKGARAVKADIQWRVDGVKNKRKAISDLEAELHELRQQKRDFERPAYKYGADQLELWQKNYSEAISGQSAQYEVFEEANQEGHFILRDKTTKIKHE